MDDPDLVILEIRLGKNHIYIINIYNEKDELGVYTLPRRLKGRILDKPFILARDLNAYYRWWNSSTKRPRNTKDLVDFISLNKGYLLNTPDLATFSRKGC